MKAGIIGSGDVAKALAEGLIKHGHDVLISSRSPKKLASWAAKHGAKFGTFAEAAQYGEIVILAVKGSAASAALHIAGASNLDGKVVIDATNPTSDEPPTNGVLNYFTEQNESLMERLQKEFASARFVKAFNAIGFGLMVNPEFEDEPPTMFICGNNKAAKRTVTKILDQFGWETADMGKVESARALESLAILWCIPGFLNNKWNHAFKLMEQK